MPLLEDISMIGLGAALAMPWLIGSMGIFLLAGSRCSVSLALGYGFFVGQVLVIAMLLAWNALIPVLPVNGLAFAPMAIVMALTAGAMGGLLLRRHGPVRCRVALEALRPRPPQWHGSVWLLVSVLVVLVLLRLLTTAQEIALRPVFAWDAWMNWVPRAVVWFHHMELTPFVLPPEWLAAGPDREVYSLGNWRASGYPPGVPLILLWTMLGAGTHDHTLVFLPWLLATVAFAMVLWGHLRVCSGKSIAALLAVYLFVSVPLVNTHTMLVGYADLWLGLYFSLGVIAADQFHQNGGRSGAAAPPQLFVGLAVLMALGCALMKTPGIVFASLGLLVLAATALRLPERWWRRLALTGLAGIAFVLALGTVAGEAGGEWVLPLPMFLPDLRLQPQPLLPILFESLLVFSNWHLLWVVLPLAGFGARVVAERSPLERPALAGLIAAAALLTFVFGFTHYFRQAENLLTLNRTLLYLVPLSVYLAGDWLATAWRAGDE